MLAFSLSSTLMTVLFSNALIIFLYFIFRNTDFMMELGYRLLAFFLVITFLRVMLPLEMPFSTNLNLSQSVSHVIIETFVEPLWTGTQFHPSVWNLFLIVWGIGSCIGFVRLIYVYYSFWKRIVVLGTDVTHDPTYRSCIEQLCEEYHKRNRFHIVRMPVISTPMIYGLGKPYILLPMNLDLNENQLYYVLSHEAAHYFHHDLWIKFVSQLICVLYWWNPFTRLLRNQINDILELRIDSHIVNSPRAESKAEYLDCLLYIAKSGARSGKMEATISLSSGNDSLLVRRFKMIIENSASKINRRRQVLFSAIIAATYLFSVLFIFEVKYIAPEDETGTFELTEENAYLIVNPNGGYDLYVDGQYQVTISQINNNFSSLEIFDSKEIDHETIH